MPLNYERSSLTVLDGAHESRPYFPDGDLSACDSRSTKQPTRSMSPFGTTTVSWSLMAPPIRAGQLPAFSIALGGWPSIPRPTRSTSETAAASGKCKRVVIIDGKNVAPTFTSGPPPSKGAVDAYYEHRFAAKGSLTPTFKVASGSVPTGLTLSDNGILYGVPTSAGTFTFSVSATNGYGPDAVTSAFTVTIAADIRHDFNGDKKSDVLARTTNGDLWLYPGNGSGGWQTPSKVGQGWNAMTALVTPGDFNGDGKADVLARDANGVLWLYPGNGQGGWQARLQVGQGWNEMTAITGIGDLDLDGNADIAARDSFGQLRHYRGNGHGGWLSQYSVGSGLNGMNFIAGPGDITKDGVQDLLTRDANGTLWSFNGYRNTSFYTGYPGRLGLERHDRHSHTRRLQRRRQRGPPGPRRRRSPLALPQQRPRRLAPPRPGRLRLERHELDHLAPRNIAKRTTAGTSRRRPFAFRTHNLRFLSLGLAS